MTEAELHLWSLVYAAVWPASGTDIGGSLEVATREADKAVEELRKRTRPMQADDWRGSDRQR